MRSVMGKKYMLYVVALIAVVLDQYTKLLVRQNMFIGQTIVVHPTLRNIFDLTYTTYSGVAFGMFQKIVPGISVLAI